MLRQNADETIRVATMLSVHEYAGTATIIIMQQNHFRTLSLF
jgi:hypothetical protein